MPPKRKKISLDERKHKIETRRFKLRINTVFKNVGFTHVPTRDKQFEFEGLTGEIDALYIYNNIIVISEDTCTKSSNISNHLNQKSIFFSHLEKNKIRFAKYLTEKMFDDAARRETGEYQPADFVFRFVYCSRERIEDSQIKKHAHIVFLHHTDLRYFENLVKVIHRSARFEFLKFMGIELVDLQVSSLSHTEKKYDSFVLPETPSGFPEGYKIVAFYADPQSLMELAYVLRKDSWRDPDGLYQRLLIKSKVKSMRDYLACEGRVYVNNVIVSLPSTTRFVDKDSRDTKDPATLTKNTYLQIELPTEFNTVGIIDGQHRVFSYYEGQDQHEKVIAAKRSKQQ